MFFKSDLMSESVPLIERRRQLKRGRWSFILYGLACLVGFLYVYAALFIIIVIPLIFVVPRLMRETE